MLHIPPTTASCGPPLNVPVFSGAAAGRGGGTRVLTVGPADHTHVPAPPGIISCFYATRC